MQKTNGRRFSIFLGFKIIYVHRVLHCTRYTPNFCRPSSFAGKNSSPLLKNTKKLSPVLSCPKIGRPSFHFGVKVCTEFLALKTASYLSRQIFMFLIDSYLNLSTRCLDWSISISNIFISSMGGCPIPKSWSSRFGVCSFRFLLFADRACFNDFWSCWCVSGRHLSG